MKTDYNHELASFLEERLGEALSSLRESNGEYRALSDEYAALICGRYEAVDEYDRAISRIADISERLGDTLKHFLFLAGLREHAKMEEALTSEDFDHLFTA